MTHSLEAMGSFNLLLDFLSLCTLQGEPCVVRRWWNMRLVGMGEWEKADGRKEPRGPVLELSQVASGAKTLREMREEGKIQQGIVTEGAFCCPWMDRASACRRNGPPLLLSPAAPHDFICWASSLVSAGKGDEVTYEGRMVRGLWGFSWRNSPWESPTDPETRKLQSKSIFSLRNAWGILRLDSTTASVTGFEAGEGSAEGTLVPSRSRNQGQAYRTMISHSGNSPQPTTTWGNKLHRSPETEPDEGTTGFQAEVVQFVMSPLHSHITTRTLLPPSSTTPLRPHCWHLWVLTSRTGGEKQPLWNGWPPHEVCHFASEVLPLFSERPKPSQPLLRAWVTSSQWSPPKPTGPGEVTLFRPPCTSMQSLLCATWIESQALAALGGGQGHSVVLRQHCR